MCCFFLCVCVSEVYDPELKVEWGTHWQELQQATTFAQWYSSVENWHQASAEQLRVGVGGVQHMQQRLNHLSTLLEQTEQALESTRRKARQAEESNGTSVDAMLMEEVRELRELQQDQEKKLLTVTRQKAALARDMNRLQKQLEEAVEARKRDQQQMEEASEGLLEDLDKVKKELHDQREEFKQQQAKLQSMLAKAREEQVTLGEQKLLAETRVQELEEQMNAVRGQAGHRCS